LIYNIRNIVDYNFSGVKRTAHKICKASFFAPCGISPLDGCPFYFKIPIWL
jgi:hypothetical protein